MKDGLIKGVFRGYFFGEAVQVRNSVAKPKKLTNPMTSVAVVKTTPPAKAGSIPTRFGHVSDQLKRMPPDILANDLVMKFNGL